MRIGDVAREAGTTVSAVRFYARAGLLTPRPRAPGSRAHREFTPDAVRVVRAVRVARALGLDLADVRALLAPAGTGTRAGRAAHYHALDRVAVELRRREVLLREARRELDRVAGRAFARDYPAAHDASGARPGPEAGAELVAQIVDVLCALPAPAGAGPAGPPPPRGGRP